MAIVRQFARSGHRFALALIDARMPDVDGFALARQIQEDPALAMPQIMMLCRIIDLQEPQRRRSQGGCQTAPHVRCRVAAIGWDAAMSQ